MSEAQSTTVRAVAWKEVFCWVHIFRAFRIAAGARVLVLGAIGALLTAIVWWFFGVLLLPAEEAPSVGTAWLQPYTVCPWKTVTDQLVPDKPSLPGLPERTDQLVPPVESWQPRDPLFGAWAQLTQPLWGLFTTGMGLQEFVCLALCGLGAAAVWALFGGAIARIASVELASDEHVGFTASLRFAARKWISYFVAPLLPLVGIAVATVPILLVAWIARFDVGLFLLGLGWPVLLLLGFVMVLLLLGLLFGWPLMWATISAEGTDSFDALSRSYAYVFQRPLHYLFYAAVAAVLGWLGWLLVRNLAAAVTWMTYWAASWTAGYPRVEAIISGEALEGVARAGAVVIHYWVGCVKLIAAGFFFGYFWVACTAIYFLLRRDVDNAPIDEVFLEADESEKSYGLPPIGADASGAPVVAEKTLADATSSAPAQQSPAGTGVQQSAGESTTPPQ